MEARMNLKGIRQMFVKIGSRNFLSAELLQMVG